MFSCACACSCLVSFSNAMPQRNDSVILMPQKSNSISKSIAEEERDNLTRKINFEIKLRIEQVSKRKINLMREITDFEDLFVNCASNKDIWFYAKITEDLIKGKLNKDKINYWEKLFVSDFIAHGILNKLFSIDLYKRTTEYVWHLKLSEEGKLELQSKIFARFRSEINALGKNATGKLYKAISFFVAARKLSDEVKTKIQKAYSIPEQNQDLIVLPESYLTGDDIVESFYQCCLETFDNRSVVSHEAEFLVKHAYEKIRIVRYIIRDVLKAYFRIHNTTDAAFFIVKFIALNDNEKNITKQAKGLYSRFLNIYLDEDYKGIMYCLLSCVCNNPSYIFFPLKRYLEKDRSKFDKRLDLFERIYEHGTKYYTENKRYFDNVSNLSQEQRYRLFINLFPGNNKNFNFVNLRFFLEAQKTNPDAFVDMLNDSPTLVNVMNFFMFATLLPTMPDMFVYRPSLYEDYEFWSGMAKVYAPNRRLVVDTKNIIFNCLSDE